MAQNNETAREFTFEEYVSQYKNDAEKLFSEEKEGCETPFANFIVRCGLRIIQLANETINRQKEYIAENAIDLINRQKTEIERLNAENMLTMAERNAFRKSFYEMCKKSKTAKSESVKEFSKSLIDKTHGGKISSTDILDFAVDYLKERADNGNV